MGGITPENIHRHVRYLADKVGPRILGTDSERSAADYVARKMCELGMCVERQEFGVSGFLPEEARLEVMKPFQIELRCVPFCYSGSTGSEGVEGELLCVGEGKSDDYEGANAEGKIVLAAQPPQGTPGIYDSLVRAASESGASGIIIAKSEGFPVSFALPSAMGLIPAVFVSSSDGGRLLMRLLRGAVRVKLKVMASFPKVSSQNVLGWLGRDRQSVGRVLLCSHLDSVVGSPGANDDASGIAVLLEAARSLGESAIRGCVGFAFFGGEEAHYKGSEAFIRARPNELDSLRAVISLDQVGVGAGSQNKLCLKTSTIHAGRRIESPEWLSQAITCAGRGKGILVEKTTVLGFSDHVPFMLRGIPGILIRWMDDPWYHSSLDTSFNVDPYKLKMVVALVVSSCLRLVGKGSLAS